MSDAHTNETLATGTDTDMQTRGASVALALAVVGCGTSNPDDDQPVDPSAAAHYRGYAAVQDDLYAKLVAPGTPFELFRYLGGSGEELSRLVGRPDGFGVTYDVRNSRPNAMNALVWRMMLTGLANDLAATCPGSTHVPTTDPPIALGAHAAPLVAALCAWPAVSDDALTAAWDLSVGYLATTESRDAWLAFAHTADMKGRSADEAIPMLWLGAFLHPSFLLEQ